MNSKVDNKNTFAGVDSAIQSAVNDIMMSIVPKFWEKNSGSYDVFYKDLDDKRMGSEIHLVSKVSSLFSLRLKSDSPDTVYPDADTFSIKNDDHMRYNLSKWQSDKIVNLERSLALIRGDIPKKMMSMNWETPDFGGPEEYEISVSYSNGEYIYSRSGYTKWTLFETLVETLSECSGIDLSEYIKEESYE